MAIEGPKLNVRGRFPESEQGKALHRYRRKAANEYKKAINRHKYGTLGPASQVRHIDPLTKRGRK
jgi:hypothetical protein